MPSTTDLFDPTSKAYKKARRQYHKATKNRSSDVESDWTEFRAAEKRYKSRFPPPDLCNVLDLATLDRSRDEEVKQGVWMGKHDAVEHVEIPARSGSAKVYAIPRIPGFVILPSFVPPEDQRHLVRWSLTRQARHPNKTNLDIHYNTPINGVWDAWLNAQHDKSKDFFVLPKSLEPGLKELPAHGPRQLVNNVPASEENFLSMSLAPKPPPLPSSTAQPLLSSSLMLKLRWANIGWYYHWGTKQYDFSEGKCAIDSEIGNVCSRAVRAVPWNKVFNGTEGDWGSGGQEWKEWDTTYEPDAGIVNFYQTKDTLMAHVDRSEVCATSPLVSISLGNAAIFLVGGLTRDSEPIPVLLRSGDAVIMSGPACRRVYHGVPRILEGTFPEHLQGPAEDIDWAPYEQYMRTTRININVRQVFPKNFDPTLGR